MFRLTTYKNWYVVCILRDHVCHDTTPISRSFVGNEAAAVISHDPIAFDNKLMHVNLIHHKRTFTNSDQLYVFDKQLESVIIGWSCSSCTFKNPSETINCSVCGQDKAPKRRPTMV